MKYILIAALFVLSSRGAHAAFIEDVDVNLAIRNPEAAATALAHKTLRKIGQNYKRDAVIALKDKGEYFDIGRVEVTGYMSQDNTDRVLPGLADKQIKPSSSADEYKGPGSNVWKWLKKEVDPGLINEMTIDAAVDFNEVKAAMRGEITKDAKGLLPEYKGKEINEIIAHSWGTELIYAAILKGYILPPKKLIVVGVPDDNHAKWETLAAMTGTEVYWSRSENDKIAKMGSVLAKQTVAAHKISFEALWREACRDRPNTCPAHNRQNTKGVIWKTIEDNPGTAGHDRMAYYKILTNAGVLKGSRHDLQAFQDAAVAAETRRLEKSALDDALIEARGLVALAREQREIPTHSNENRNQGSLWDNVDSEEFRRSIAELKGSKPAPGQAPQYITPVTPVAHTPFYTAFPSLKNYAVTACRATGQVPVDTDSINPAAPFSFSKDMDDQTADRLSAGLDACESRLFRRLIEVIRSGQGDRISSEWVQETAASYRPAPPPDRSSGYTPRPPREERSEPSEPGCYWDSSINARVCPK